MNASAYDEQVRSLINGRLRGMGKRLSTYCAAVVDGGDIEELSRDFADGVDGAIEDGVREVWEVSNTMRREIQNEAKKRKRKTAGDAVITTALLLALQSFLTRKERVMVDDMAQHLARQTRSALPLLTGEGTKERGRQLAEYIKNPVRINIDKTNHSESNTPILHPQPSFFSRMRRILVTEMATAYRTAEYHAWQLLPFVVGQEIRLGKKHPVPDICDDLQGIYPKEFKFTGWHPWCRCFARPVFSWESDKVRDMPENFNEWVEKNADKIEKARERGTLPQWIKDNEKFVGKSFNELYIRNAKKKFNSYNDDWIQELFCEKNGGYNVYHRLHQFANTKANGAKMTGGEAEKHVGRMLAEKNGKQVEFLPENGKSTGKPDLSFDNRTWDVKYISKANENTIRSYYKDAKKAQAVIFYSEIKRDKDIITAVNRERGRLKSLGRDVSELPVVYVMNEDGGLRGL